MQLDVVQNAKRNIVFGTINKTVLLLCPFIERTILHYILGSQYLGLNNLFASILSVLSLTELGFSSAMIYHMYKPVAEDNIDSERKSFIGVSGYNMGRDYGDQLCDYVKSAKLKHCNAMVLLDNNQTSTTQSIILTAIREKIDMNKLSEIINLESKAVTSNQDFAAEEEIRDLFMEGDKIPDVIICLSEKNTVCVAQAVVDFTKVGEVEIFGYYLSPYIEESLNKNVIRSSIVVNNRWDSTL